MANVKILAILENFGLNEKEIELYLASLQLGACGMTGIAKKANVKRSTAYTVFESLEKRGLMLSRKFRGATEYFSLSPRMLLQQARRNMSDIEKIVPELNALVSENIQTPTITYFEGIENYKRILEESLSVCDSEVLLLGNMQPVVEILGKKYDSEYYIPKRIRNNIKMRVLLPGNFDDTPTTSRFHSDLLREIRILPVGAVFNSLVVVYGDIVVNVHVADDIYITRMDAKYLADDERAKFEMMWLIGREF